MLLEIQTAVLNVLITLYMSCVLPAVRMPVPWAATDFLAHS